MKTEQFPSMTNFVSLVTPPTLSDLHRLCSVMDRGITVYQGGPSSVLGPLSARDIAELEMGR